MYGAEDVAKWAGRQGADSAAATGAVPEAAVTGDTSTPDESGEAASGIHSSTLGTHAQSLKDLAEVIKGDIKQAIVDDALDVETKDTAQELAESLSGIADQLVELSEAAGEAEKAQAEAAEEDVDEDEEAPEADADADADADVE